MDIDKMGLSRRSFLASAGVLAAGAGAASFGLAGCSPSSSSGDDGATSGASGAQGDSEFTMQSADSTVEADVIVVGGGMGGLSAALEASDQGAHVVLIEAGSDVGGGTAYAEGMFGAGTKMQEELGITDLHPEEVLAIEYDFQNFNVNTKMWESVAHDSAANIDWLMDKGVVFDTVTGMGDTNLCWHVYEDGHGATAVAYLKSSAESQGVEIHTDTRATVLIVENDEVVGVQAESKDGYVDYRGKAVILACGGFSANEDYIDAYSNFEIGSYRYNGVPSARGDGIRMVSEVTGERPKNTTVCVVGLGVPEFALTAQLGICGAMESTNMWVNEEGVRYVAESISRQPSECGNALKCQNQRTFSFFDQKAYDRFKTDGLVTGYGMYVPPGTVCDELDGDVEEYADNEHWWKADTMEELVEAMGLDVDTVGATLARYNEMCVAGNDTDYGKPADYLVPIDEGPFYAFEIKPIVLCTMGGIRVDMDCRVCNRDMETVPGLYGASDDVSGFQGETYGITVSGSAQAIACWSGRIAGKSATEYATV